MSSGVSPAAGLLFVVLVCATFWLALAASNWWYDRKRSLPVSKRAVKRAVKKSGKAWRYCCPRCGSQHFELHGPNRGVCFCGASFTQQEAHDAWKARQ